MSDTELTRARRRRPPRSRTETSRPLPPRPSRIQIVTYFAVLALASGLGDPGGLASVPLLFLLKDRFGLGPEGVAVAEALIFLPVYAGFLFGFARDRVRLGALGDRGWLLLAAPVAAAGYFWLATTRLTLAGLLAGVFVVMTAYQFIDTAAQALMTSVGRRSRTTGLLSALSEAGDTVSGVLAALLGGWLVARQAYGAAFLVAGGLTLMVLVQGFWKPDAVFPRRPAPAGTAESALDAIRRLFAHRAIWPAMAVLVLWNFSPGWGTPLFYFLTDQLALSSEAYGLCRALHVGATALALPVYGIASRRFALRPTLRTIILLNVFPGVLFLLISTPAQAASASLLIGFFSSLAHIAIFDLLMRACPTELEGTASMTALAAFSLAGTVGDLVGSSLYAEGGFAFCIAADALATMLILPVLRRVPTHLLATPDA